jgi:hypothetical protein
MTSPFEAMKNVVYSKGMIDPDQIKGIEVLVAKALGFIDPDTGSRCSKYWAAIDPEIYRGLLACELARHGRMPSWIKKPQAQQADVLDKLIFEYLERYHLEKRLFDDNPDVFRKIVIDNLKDFLIQINADPKTFKKFGVKLQ